MSNYTLLKKITLKACNQIFSSLVLCDGLKMTREDDLNLKNKVTRLQFAADFDLDSEDSEENANGDVTLFSRQSKNQQDEQQDRDLAALEEKFLINIPTVFDYDNELSTHLSKASPCCASATSLDRPIISKGAQNKRKTIENVRHDNEIYPFTRYIWPQPKYASRVSLHWHPEVELVRFYKGDFKVSIDMKEIDIQDDAFLLLPGNIMHTFTMPPNAVESAIVFDTNMLRFQSFDEMQFECFDALRTGNIPQPAVITPEHEAFSHIDELYNYCIENGNSEDSLHRMMVKTRLLEILAIYYKYGLISRKDSTSDSKKSKQDKLKDLLKYVDIHYAEAMSIKDAAQRLNVTEQYFCRFFKRVTGMSFTQYLNDIRLRRAAVAIEATSRSIADIAYEHGFESAGYFFKSFKNKYGITPLKYRKNSLKKHAIGKIHKDTTIIPQEQDKAN